jgi:hypothetical protein
MVLLMKWQHWFTVIAMLLQDCQNFVILLSHWCYTAVSRLLHCCDTVATLLLQSCYTIVTQSMCVHLDGAAHEVVEGCLLRSLLEPDIMMLL